MFDRLPAAVDENRAGRSRGIKPHRMTVIAAAKAEAEAERIAELIVGEFSREVERRYERGR